MPRKPMPIRDLFVNTGERSAGSAVPIWACRRCGWKLVDNATRFARHVLRCPSTQPGDRDLAQEHLASLGGTSTAQLEAISANADEFGRAFTLEGKAQIRNLFEDTQLRRSGEKAKLFRCKRCGHETTENATRFAQHILKCEEATTLDRAVASEHQQLTAKRREMRQAKHGGPGGVAVKAEVREAREGPNSSSSVPSTEKAGSAGRLGSSTSINGSVDDTGSQDVVSEGAGSASRSTSQSSLAPAEAPEVKAEAPPGLQEAQGGGGGGVPSEPPCTVLHINSQPALGDSLLRDSNHDIINLDLLDCFVDDGFEEELARLQQPSFMNGPSGGDTARGTSGTAFQSRSRAPSGEMAFGHSIPNRDHSYAQPSHRHTANQSYLQQPDPVSSGTYSHAQPPQHMAHPATNPHVSQPPQHHQASPAFANLQPSHDEFHANRNLSQASNTSVSFEEIEDLLPSLRMLPTSNNASHDGRGNECTALSPVFHKRQRDNRGESLPAETVSISFDEYQQWKQWKEQVERPKIIQVPDMEHTMFQNLYSFMLSHAMNCTKTYMAHKGLIGPSCNTEMIGRAISKEWTSLASVYRTMVTCCAKAQARFVLDKAGTCPERVAGICDSALAIAQDCLSSGIAGALHKWFV
uniref:Uncharacterized protein n=1 Tax=Tetraselmis chuii TaxID=63592 RepID=A0A7S1SVT1_9CHLO|mmetsp:Transcript_32076/g.57433  ORF Transcript_32076/g.57433 Transcript_32076/m.57433 type:complete len:636 (+) Transcript_32076:321-2228(+)